jgi:hypothetical protein
MRKGVYERRAAGIAIEARVGLIGGRGNPAPQVSSAGRTQQTFRIGNLYLC